MKTEAAFRMGFQKVHLLLQFAWIGKIVVTIAYGCIFGSATAEQGAHIGAFDISTRQEYRPDTRVLARVVRDDFPCAVRGAVIDNNVLHGKICTLRQNAFYCLAYICGLVVGQGEHGKQRLRTPGRVRPKGGCQLPFL